jgi:bile acid:Na+ symporter, BASS family
VKAYQIIEKHFWIFLLAGIMIGLWKPFEFEAPKFLPKVLLGMMLFFVFLKIDFQDIIKHIKDYKLMSYIAVVYMMILPILFYLLFRIFDRELALGILLLTAMPTGVSTPALTDIVKGNMPLTMSVALVTQAIAPLTVPLLFWIVGTNGLEINKLLLLRDIAIMVFSPMILAVLVKRYLPASVRKTRHLFTSANVMLLFFFVLIAISSQREVIISDPLALIWKAAVLYAVFIMLHIAGYRICPGSKKENKIALSVSAAYMNNGLAIVLAASYFSPNILVLMVLSEIPWNTLLAPFKRVVRHL